MDRSHPAALSDRQARLRATRRPRQASRRSQPRGLALDARQSGTRSASARRRRQHPQLRAEDERHQAVQRAWGARHPTLTAAVVTAAPAPPRTDIRSREGVQNPPRYPTVPGSVQGSLPGTKRPGPPGHPRFSTLGRRSRVGGEAELCNVAIVEAGARDSHVRRARRAVPLGLVEDASLTDAEAGVAEPLGDTLAHEVGRGRREHPALSACPRRCPSTPLKRSALAAVRAPRARPMRPVFGRGHGVPRFRPRRRTSGRRPRLLS